MRSMCIKKSSEQKTNQEFINEGALLCAVMSHLPPGESLVLQGEAIEGFISLISRATQIVKRE